KAGAFDYILKPFKVSAILPVISRAMAVRRLRLENAELQQRIRERTAELEEANKELEAFSFSVSHDLRAPLRAMRGFSEILLHDYSPQLPPEAQHLLSRVIWCVREMEQLTEDLLRLSRYSRQPLFKAPVNISGLVREVVEELRGEQKERS